MFTKLQQQPNRVLYYGVWDPLTKSWTPEDSPVVAPTSWNLNLTMDESTDKMYLFWDEQQENAIYYTVKELDKPVLPPTISPAGPLQLHANYPNPFSSSTRITFTLEESAEVEIKIYEMSGRQILHKNLGVKPVGTHTEDVNLNNFASGVYIYEIELNETWRQQSTMTYMK
ncbi:MAG: T9SS type A sorting domain-containing protein [Balneolaceae bacterium]